MNKRINHFGCKKISNNTIDNVYIKSNLNKKPSSNSNNKYRIFTKHAKRFFCKFAEFSVDFRFKDHFWTSLFFFASTIGIPLAGLILFENIQFAKLTFSNLYSVANSFFAWNVADIIIFSIITVVNSSMILKNEKMRIFIAFAITSIGLCFDFSPFFYYMHFGKIEFALQSLLFSVWMPFYVYVFADETKVIDGWYCKNLQDFQKDESDCYEMYKREIYQEYEIHKRKSFCTLSFPELLKEQQKFNIYLFFLLGIYVFVIFLFIENIMHNSFVCNKFLDFSYLNSSVPSNSTLSYRAIFTLQYLGKVLPFLHYVTIPLCYIIAHVLWS